MKKNALSNTSRSNNLKKIREDLNLIIFKKKEYNLRSLSRYLGKNDAYLQQYIKRGSPSVLPEEERIKLCSILEINSEFLTPIWLQKKVDNSKTIKILSKQKNTSLEFSKKIFKDLSFSNEKNLFFHEFILTENVRKILLVVDIGINKFQDDNDYILDDKNVLFLVNLKLEKNRIIQGFKKLIVSPIEEKYPNYRVFENKIKIYGKVILKSSTILI